MAYVVWHAQDENDAPVLGAIFRGLDPKTGAELWASEPTNLCGDAKTELGPAQYRITVDAPGRSTRVAYDPATIGTNGGEIKAAVGPRTFVPPVLRVVQAAFCDHTDAQGRIIFDAAYPAYDDPTRADWRARKHDMGVTHVVLAPKFGYPGFPSFDLLPTPETFRLFVLEMLNDDFVPLIMCSTGDGGSFDAETPHWPKLFATLQDIADRCLWCPGWELVGPGGGWTSKQFADGIALMDKYLPKTALIAAHLQPTRATFASNPVEPDDPFKGDEVGAWHSPTGQRIDFLWYQTQHGDPLLHPNTEQERIDKLAEVNRELAARGEPPRTTPWPLYDWQDRWQEIVDRLGVGGHDWPKKDLVLFETVANDYVHGRASDGDAQTIARLGQQQCQAAGISCGFGNGLP